MVILGISNHLSTLAYNVRGNTFVRHTWQHRGPVVRVENEYEWTRDFPLHLLWTRKLCRDLAHFMLWTISRQNCRNNMKPRMKLRDDITLCFCAQHCERDVVRAGIVSLSPGDSEGNTDLGSFRWSQSANTGGLPVTLIYMLVMSKCRKGHVTVNSHRTESFLA